MPSYLFDQHKARLRAFPSHKNLLRNPSLPALSRMSASHSTGINPFAHRDVSSTAALFESLTNEARTACSTPAPHSKPGTSFDIEDAKRVLKLSDNVPNPVLPITPPGNHGQKSTYAELLHKPQTTAKPTYLHAKSEDNVFQPGLKPVQKQKFQLRQPAAMESLQNPSVRKSPGEESLVAEHMTFENAPDHVKTPETKPPPRADRMNEPITPENAQGVFPPEACVFVANLSVSRTDEELQRSCASIFYRFGPCVVKVRRDKHKHPYALVQYHTVEDAEKAVNQSNNIVIDGRLIRTEHGKARRAVILTKSTGEPIPEAEARRVLHRCGPIAQLRPTTNRDAKDYGVPVGMWIEFAYYLDYKETLKRFRNSPHIGYHLCDAPYIEADDHASPTEPFPAFDFHTPRSTTDEKSIFVGNLPTDITEAELCNIFKAYGEIKGCNIIRKPLLGGPGFNIFGFIEFLTTDEADKASKEEVYIREHKIRVEPKEYSARRHTRLGTGAPPSSPVHTPPNRNTGWHLVHGSYQHPMMSYGSTWFPFGVLGGMMPGPYMPNPYNSATPPSSANRRPYQPTIAYGGSPGAGHDLLPVAHRPSTGGSSQSSTHGGISKNLHANWRTG